MKKTSTINLRIPESLKESIIRIVNIDKQIKNISDFGFRAITYFLEKKYDIKYDKQTDEYLDNKELILLRQMIPEDLHNTIENNFMKDNNISDVTDAYRQYFFIHGIEKDIKAKNKQE